MPGHSKWNHPPLCCLGHLTTTVAHEAQSKVRSLPYEIFLSSESHQHVVSSISVCQGKTPFAASRPSISAPLRPRELTPPSLLAVADSFPFSHSCPSSGLGVVLATARNTVLHKAAVSEILYTYGAVHDTHSEMMWQQSREALASGRTEEGQHRVDLNELDFPVKVA
jgi:hypothetical protein